MKNIMIKMSRVIVVLVYIAVITVAADYLVNWVYNKFNPYVRVSTVWPWTKQPPLVDVDELARILLEAEPNSTIIIRHDGKPVLLDPNDLILFPFKREDFRNE